MIFVDLHAGREISNATHSQDTRERYSSLRRRFARSDLRKNNRSSLFPFVLSLLLSHTCLLFFSDDSFLPTLLFFSFSLFVLKFSSPVAVSRSLSFFPPQTQLLFSLPSYLPIFSFLFFLFFAVATSACHVIALWVLRRVLHGARVRHALRKNELPTRATDCESASPRTSVHQFNRRSTHPHARTREVTEGEK